MYFNTR